MSTHHPARVDLVRVALAEEGEAKDDPVKRHVRDCASCRRDLAELREVAHAVRLSPPKQPTDPCLDEIELASVLDGVASATLDRRAIRHLAACARCRAQLAAASRLLREPLITAELERLAMPAPRPSRRRTYIAIASGLAAAALAGLLLWPQAARLSGPVPESDADAYRERTLTTTAAPHILGPLGDASASRDSFIWTSVPRADLYRVSVWDRDGSLAWEGQTRDTVLLLPAALTGGGGRTLLWDVKARTGWDRWVSSNLAELTITEPGRVMP